MGCTVIEKIISLHTDSDIVKPGDIVWIGLDVRTARDFGGANVVKRFQKEYPKQKVDDPSKTFFTFDCNVPANTIGYADNQQICRIFAREQGIKVYDVDAGIGSHIAIEQGLAYPGITFVGTDSHLNILGAVGAFGQGMGDADIAYGFRHGRTWFEVPASMKITFKGVPRSPVSSKDITLKVLREIGSAGALGRSIEYYGTAVDKLKLHGRITLASMATEMGAVTAMIPPNEDILNYCRHAVGKDDIEGIYADTDAEYVEELEIDLTDMKLQIACPPSPESVVDVADVAGTKIDSVFIGSCTGGRFEDFVTAAALLRGNKVADGVMLKLQPSTKYVYGQMLKADLMQVFYEAGGIVINPGCGGCAQGQVGMTGKGEVQLSTSNRNFIGKQGAGDTYLCSAYVAAKSAIAGEIVE